MELGFSGAIRGAWRGVKLRVDARLRSGTGFARSIARLGKHVVACPAGFSVCVVRMNGLETLAADLIGNSLDLLSHRYDDLADNILDETRRPEHALCHGFFIHPLENAMHLRAARRFHYADKILEPYESHIVKRLPNLKRYLSTLVMRSKITDLQAARTDS